MPSVCAGRASLISLNLGAAATAAASEETRGRGCPGACVSGRARVNAADRKQEERRHVVEPPLGAVVADEEDEEADAAVEHALTPLRRRAAGQ